MAFTNPAGWGNARGAACLILGWMCLSAAAGAWADDWPQWRGPRRDGTWTETGILEKFPEAGLAVAWRKPVRSGYSGPVVAAGQVYILDWAETPGKALEGTERLLCLDEKTGETKWEISWQANYAGTMATYATGPRASAAVDGDRVYYMGSVGHFGCASTVDGKVLWEKEAVKDYGLEVPTWGTSSSPLVDGAKVIIVAGAKPDGQVMAFDKMTGKEIWRALASEGELGYAQPVIIEAGGARQLIAWMPKMLASLDPETGKVNWQEAWEAGSGMTVATPVRAGDRLFVTQFYRGSLMMNLDAGKPSAAKVWVGQSKSEVPGKTDGLHSLITTPIIEGDYIYGVCSYGELRCLKAATGERVWESDKMTRQGRWGAAFLVKNGDRYFVNNDLGDLIIARFSPEGYEEISRTKLIEPTTEAGFGPRRLYGGSVNWSHPAYANKHIFARNDKELIRASLAK